MRVILTPELSVFIADRIKGYLPEATEHYHFREAPSVAEHAALPLIRHWFETIGIRQDGEIVQWSTEDEYPGVRLIENRYDWLSALVEGSRRYPELSALLPRRGPRAVDCLCVGNVPFALAKMICPDCCGLGWVQRSDDFDEPTDLMSHD